MSHDVVSAGVEALVTPQQQKESSLSTSRASASASAPGSVSASASASTCTTSSTPSMDTVSVDSEKATDLEKDDPHRGEKDQQEQLDDDDDLSRSDEAETQQPALPLVVMGDNNNININSNSNSNSNPHTQVETPIEPQQAQSQKFFERTIVVSSLFSSGSLLMLIIELLELRGLLALVLFCSSSGVLGYSFYKRLLLQFEALVVEGNGLLPYLPESFQRGLTEYSLHETLTAEGEDGFMTEYKFLWLYFIPGVSRDQLAQSLQRLAPKHRRMLLRKGLCHFMGPRFSKILLGRNNQNNNNRHNRSTRTTTRSIRTRTRSTRTVTVLTPPNHSNATNTTRELLPPDQQQQQKPQQVSYNNNNTYDDDDLSSAGSDLGDDIENDDEDDSEEGHHHTLEDFKRMYSELLNDVAYSVVETQVTNLMDMLYSYVHFNKPTTAQVVKGSFQSAAMGIGLYSAYATRATILNRPFWGITRSITSGLSLHPNNNKHSSRSMSTPFLQGGEGGYSSRLWWAGTIIGTTGFVGTLVWRSLIMEKGLTSKSSSSSTPESTTLPSTPPSQGEKKSKPEEEEESKPQEKNQN